MSRMVDLILKAKELTPNPCTEEQMICALVKVGATHADMFEVGKEFGMFSITNDLMPLVKEMGRQSRAAQEDAKEKRYAPDTERKVPSRH